MWMVKNVIKKDNATENSIHISDSNLEAVQIRTVRQLFFILFASWPQAPFV